MYKSSFSDALVRKFEYGSGENRINVWIFKEPTGEADPVETQKGPDTKQVDDTRVMRLPKYVREMQATPPSTRAIKSNW